MIGPRTTNQHDPKRFLDRLPLGVRQLVSKRLFPVAFPQVLQRSAARDEPGENRAQIGGCDARAAQRRAKRGQRARRPRIDERRAAGAVQHRRRDDAGHVEKVHIDVRDACSKCIHAISDSRRARR